MKFHFIIATFLLCTMFSTEAVVISGQQSAVPLNLTSPSAKGIVVNDAIYSPMYRGVVNSVDEKNNFIYINGNRVEYQEKTSKFYDIFGKIKDISIFKSGVHVRFLLDNSSSKITYLWVEQTE